MAQVQEERMNIYVGNLPYSVTDQDLKQLFEQYGEVSSAKVIMDKFTGRSKGFAFVEMPDNGAAQQAVDALNDQDFMGRPLRANESQPRPPRGDGGGYGGGGGGGGYGGGGSGGGYGGGGGGAGGRGGNRGGRGGRGGGGGGGGRW